MAHLKLDLLLAETGYRSDTDQRFRVYLTNSLEEHHKDTGTLFANWLSTEANEANYVKRDTPVMCVIGNPPYAVSSTNKGDWVQALIADYKKNLNERKINLDDDYIKFIRYGQHYIDKNGSGVLAYISNNSFIDGITHRQMRKSLLKSFDKIYILDLHGSAKKNETAPDGSKDENVFDIQQGVSLNIFSKTGRKKKNELGTVFHSEFYGKRSLKYENLNQNSLFTIKWNKLKNVEPYFFFVPKDFKSAGEYKSGFKINDLMDTYVSGFQTKRDKVTINIKSDELQDVKTVFIENDNNEIRRALKLPADGRDWKIEWAKEDLLKNEPIQVKVMYRPFDNRYTFFTGKSKGFVAYPRSEMYGHLNNPENISLITCRQQSTFDFQHAFTSRLVSDMCNISSQTKETGYIFPLYLYPEPSGQKTIEQDSERTPNLKAEIVKQIAEKLGLTFTHEKETTENTFAPIDLLDYIYAVLHSPTYREKYKEFLKIDFPRVPYPTNSDTFWKLVEFGGELRKVHLLESPVVEDFITTYPINGDNTITRRLTKRSPGFELTDEANGIGRVWINDEQYFDQVPQKAFTFYIGGYQPAEKWLKDRRDRTLSYEDILHYQKIIKAMMETDRLMQEIDEVDLEEV